jgi:GNAT superfamily N-acetyltransferase
MGEIIPLQERAGPSLSRPSAISKDHDTSKFFSRHECLNDWLKERALKSEARTARTYVVCADQTVVAYYTVATGSVTRATAPSKIRRNTPDPIPVAIIGRLAVDSHYERKGIGSGMLKDALQRIAQMSFQIGCRAVLVHAIDNEAAAFFSRYGFVEFPNGSKTMFLPIETVIGAIVEAG